MNNTVIIVQKVVYLFALFLCGAIVKNRGLLSEQGEKDLSALTINFFWPMLIISQITKLSAEDIGSNLALPLLAILTGAFGWLVGLIIVRFAGIQGKAKDIFLYDSTVNNFVFMVIPFVVLFYPEKGLGLLFIHNIGFILIIWTLGISFFTGGMNFKKSIKGVINPGFLATVGSILIVILGLERFIPATAADVFAVMGGPTLPVSMLVAGAGIYKLGTKALLLDRWNLLLGASRLIITPTLLLLVALVLRHTGIVPRETLGIFMLVNLMPVSVVSISMAIRYDSDRDLASQGVMSNHVFSLVTIPAYMFLCENLGLF